MNECRRTNLVYVNNYLTIIKYVFLKYKTIILIACLIFSILLLSIGIISTSVEAEKSVFHEKTVTSVKIEKGESLWSIAKEYYTEDFGDMKTYVKEIKRSNGLDTDIIHEDSYIIVPYYTN